MVVRRPKRTKVAPRATMRLAGNCLPGLRAELAGARRELRTLYAALDNIQSGLLLLDGDLRACYSNPVLHTIFKALSAEQIKLDRPHYRDMLERAAGADAVEVDKYVARRLDWVESGDSTPMDLPMTDGSIIRSQLAILPGGGRMLIYSDVSDIVRVAQKMEKLANIDGMTGIYNRRHFLTLADREWERARRHGRSLSFLMIDIDHFKLVNDHFGHEAGDAVIVRVVNLALACKRKSDVLARIGGEEFALLLPETALSAARLVAEKLRERVAENQLPGVSQPATISVGVASVDRGMSSISELMKAADHALYAAKRNGRNRVVCAVSDARSPDERNKQAGLRFLERLAPEPKSARPRYFE